jgi:group I intron endonuclease
MPLLRGLAGPEYNILKVAGSSLGYKHLPEIRIRISEALSGDKSPLFGKIYSPEMRAKMSEALTGKIATQLTKEKMSEAHTGKIYRKKLSLR